MKNLFSSTSCPINRPNLALLCVALGANSVPLYAQQDPVSGLVLEEVTVTATRRATDIQSTSIAVSAFGGDQLKHAGVDGMRDLVDFVPNVYMAESGGAASTPISIRGVGDNQLGLGGDGSVAIYVDGVYQGRPYGNVFDLVNVERLEILRGPQGTLYGRNATGGAINVITRSPDDELEVFGDIRYGNYDSKRIRAGVLAPLVEGKMYGGLSGSWSDRDGYSKNLYDGKDYNEESTMNVQGELRFTPTEALDIRWRADAGHNEASLVFYSFIDPLTGEGITDRDDIDSDHTNIDGLPPYEDREWWGTSVTASYDATDFTLKSITAYRENKFDEKTDPDALPYDYAIFELEEEQEQVSQEFIITSNNGGRFEWLGGLSLYHEETNGFQHTDIPVLAPGVFIEAIASNETDAYAVYFEGAYDLTEKLKLTAGLRYSDEEKSYQFEQVSFGADNIPQVEGDVSFDSLNPRLVLDYQYSEDVFLYGSVGTGFKSGGFSAINPVALTTSPTGHPDRFDEENVTAFEIGAKMELLERRLRMNSAVFFYEYEDLHTNVTDSIGFAKVVPADEAEVWGIEVESTFALTSNFLLQANASYLDATYDAILSYPDGLGGTKIDDLRGNTLPRAPEVTFSLGLNYKQDVDFGTFNYRADWFYVSETFLTELNNDVDRETSSNIINARIAYTTPSESYDITVFVNNATDEQLRAHSKPILGTIHRGMLTPPRTYGLEVAFRF